VAKISSSLQNNFRLTMLGEKMTKWTYIKTSIGVTEEMKRKIHEEMRRLGIKSYAEFFRHLLRVYFDSR